MNQTNQTNASSGKTPPSLKKKLKNLWKEERSYLKRLGYTASVMLALCFTFMFFGPLEMVAFSSDSLSYSYWDVAGLLLGTMGAVFLVTVPVLSLLRGKIYNYALCSLLSVTLCGYLQAALFNGQMGTLTGDGIAWGDSALGMLLNLCLWIGITVVLYFVMYLNKSVWQKLCVFVSLLLVAMQVAPTVLILTGSYEKEKVSDIEGYSLSEKGLYEYGKSDNVFVFVLDRLDYDYIEGVLEKDSGFFAPLDGFTQYTNAMSAYARTRPALSHLLASKENMEYLAYLLPTDQYYKDIWTANGGDLLDELKKAGYDVGLYTSIQYLFSNGAYARKNVDNATNGESRLIGTAVLRKMLQLSAYRYSPLAMKPFFWADTAYYNKDIRAQEESTPYSFDDAKYLAGFGGAAVGQSDKVFRMVHLMGSHAPYNLTAQGTAVPEGTTSNVTDQTMGVFRRLYEAFDRMKELGIYEDATIIITADHGNTVDDAKPVQKATTIGLFYKPSGSAGTGLKLSSAPVCVDQLPATILKAAGVDYQAFGRALDEIGEDENVVRYYFKSVVIAGREQKLLTYAVTGDATDFDNWKLVKQSNIVGRFY